MKLPRVSRRPRRLRGAHHLTGVPKRSSGDLTPAEIVALAASHGCVVVPTDEYENWCAEAASLFAAVAEADGEFDKILYQ